MRLSFGQRMRVAYGAILICEHRTCRSRLCKVCLRVTGTARFRHCVISLYLVFGRRCRCCILVHFLKGCGGMARRAVDRAMYTRAHSGNVVLMAQSAIGIWAPRNTCEILALFRASRLAESRIRLIASRRGRCLRCTADQTNQQRNYKGSYRPIAPFALYSHVRCPLPSSLADPYSARRRPCQCTEIFRFRPGKTIRFSYDLPKIIRTDEGFFRKAPAPRT